MARLRPDQLFAGRYRVKREVMRGALGVRYDVEHQGTGEALCLDVPYRHVVGDEGILERLVDDARSAAHLAGTNAPQVREAGIDGETGLAYLVGPPRPEETVAARMVRDGPLRPKQALALVRQLGATLGPAHRRVEDGQRRPLVHGRLEPECLLVEEEALAALRLTVVGFGLGTAAAEASARRAEIIGTTSFLSSEQLAGTVADARSDVWSMGLIAFHLLTARSYWRAANLTPVPTTALFWEVLEGPLDPASERARAIGAEVDLHPAFDAWFARCVTRDRDARFADADEATAALPPSLTRHGALASLPRLRMAPAARRSHAPRGQSTWSPRRVVAAPLAVAALAVTGWLLLRDPATTDPAAHHSNHVELCARDEATNDRPARPPG